MLKTIIISIIFIVGLLSGNNFYDKKLDASAESTVNLLGNLTKWNEHNYANLNQSSGNLNISVHTDKNDTIYNRASATVNVSKTVTDPILKIVYSTNASKGNPQFVFETITNGTMKHSETNFPLMQYFMPSYNEPKSKSSINLGNTLGFVTTRSYDLNPAISGSTAEIRLYIITNGTTDAEFEIKNATISERS